MINFKRKKGELDCRLIETGFADRSTCYQIVAETKRKYILKWVAGEDPYPDWGAEIKLFKKHVQEMILERDRIEIVSSIKN